MGLKKSSRPVGLRRFPMAQLGYGNITPVSKVARMLAAMEAMTGLLYIAVVIARLIGLYFLENPNDPEASRCHPHRQSREIFCCERFN